MKSRPLEKTTTPGIYKRGGRYVVIYRDPNGRQRKQAAETMAEARAIRKTIGADIVRGEYRAASRESFADYAAGWCVTYQGRTRRGIADGTRSDYTDAIEKHAIPKLGRLRLAEVTPQHLRELVTDLDKAGLAPGSVRKIIAPVRALFATALEDGQIRSNPATGVRIASRREDVNLDDDDEQVKALDADDLRALLADVRCERHGRKPEAGTCANCDAWRLFVRFLAETGLRIGEAVEVRYADVDGDGWLRVRRNFTRGKVGRPKGGKIRRVRLTGSLAADLSDRRRSTWAGDGDLVFGASQGARVNGHNFARRILKPAAKRAGIGEWVSPHTMRHTAATLLFRAGWNAVQVQHFLGHADAGFTLRTYVHLLPEDMPSTEFLADITTGRGNKGATQPTETRRELAVVAAV